MQEEISMRKKSIFVFMVLLILTVPSCYSRISFDTSVANDVGSEASNILHGGYVAKQGNSYVYLKERNILLNEYNISSVDTNDGASLKPRGDISNINIIGEWVFYVKANKDWLNSITYYNLYRYNLRTGYVQRLIDNCYFVNIIGDRIYYEVYFDETHFQKAHKKYDTSISGNICSASLDGTDRKTLTSGSYYGYIISGNQLYYLDKNSKLMKTDLNGNCKEQIYSGDAGYSVFDFAVVNDVVYILEWNNDSQETEIRTIGLDNNKTYKVAVELRTVDELIVIGKDMYLNANGDVYKLSENGTLSSSPIAGRCKDLYCFQSTLYIWTGQSVELYDTI
jgi:hypothetical protein